MEIRISQELLSEWNYKKTQQFFQKMLCHIVIRRYGGYVKSVVMNGKQHLIVEVEELAAQYVEELNVENHDNYPE